MNILNAVVALVVIGVVLWAVNAMPIIDATMKRIITILVIVASVLWLLSSFGLLNGLGLRVR